jgi:hypothetical protein
MHVVLKLQNKPIEITGEEIHYSTAYCRNELSKMNEEFFLHLFA